MYLSEYDTEKTAWVYLPSKISIGENLLLEITMNKSPNKMSDYQFS